MANNEAGAFLNITPDVLKKLDSFDEKLEKIEKHAHTAADALKNGFGKVVIDTTKLENAITSLANKMNALNSAGNAIGNIGTSAQGSARNVSSMNESLSRAAELMNRIGSNKIGEGSFSTWNIKGLNQYYSDLKKYVENADLSKPQQEAAIRAMQYMKMELAEQRKTDEQRAQSAEKAAKRKEAADRQAAKAAADLAKQQELAQRTTPQGALDYSKNTKSLKENVQAIEYLKKARLSLNTTDKNYQATLQQINQAIAKHNQALQQAGVQSQNLATRHRNLMGTAGQLQRKLALVFSVSQIEGYVKKIVEVRGQFELQQVALRAIIQDKDKADKIFSQTLNQALKSPFQASQLITFTKQLAAYRIESDKLFDTTKRLADVSAGLGVDMQRLILAYGQVKAAAYLRGTEVRQFTEAGINLYGELQSYFQEVKGEAYSTAQIVDMISKRMVKFEDVEAVFQRLTDKGGLFYNMQEIQVNTLHGQVERLKDVFAIMQNEIGKSNQEGFMSISFAIELVNNLASNWRTVAAIIKSVVAGYAAYKAAALAMWAIENVNMAKSISMHRTSISFKLKDIMLARSAAAANAANGTAIAGAAVAQRGFNAAVASNPYGAVLAVVLALGTAIYEVVQNTNRLEKALNDIASEGAFSASQSANNYARLASTVADSTKSYQEHNKALAELKRKYSDILPEQYINAEGIKALNGNYEKAIETIHRYINAKTKERMIDEVGQEANKKMYSSQQKVSKEISKIIEEQHGMKVSWSDINSEIGKVQDKLMSGAIKSVQQLREETEKVVEEYTGLGNIDLSSYFTRLSGSSFGGADRFRFDKIQIENDKLREWFENTKSYLNQIESIENRFNRNSLSMTAQRYQAQKDETDKMIANAMSAYDVLRDSQKKNTKVTKEELENARTLVQNVLKAIGSDVKVDSAYINKLFNDSFFFEDEKRNATQTKLQQLFNKLSEDAKKSGDESGNLWLQEFQKQINSLDLSPLQNTIKRFLLGIGGNEDIQANWVIRSGETEEEFKKRIKTEIDTRNEIVRKASSTIYPEYGQDVSKVTSELEELNRLYNELGGDKKKGLGSKAERDIWAERISVLKEMQSRYEKLNQLMGENAAIEQTLSAFKPALKFTGMDEMNILPTKEGMIKAYEELLKDVTDSKKITELKKIIAELKIEIQQEDLKNQLDKTKKNIEDMFNGLDLHKKLKDAGLSEAEVQQLFPGLAKTLDDVQRGIEESYKKNFQKGEYLTKGTDANKQYMSEIDKLNQQRVKESQDLVVELTKNYKTQLSDQMQLDTWYIKERSKIYSKAYDEQTKTFKDVLTPEMQKQYESNLNKEYQKRSSENTWKNFQATDSYISMFENMDKMSGEAIQRMLEKLESLRSSLKGLPADQVRAIINQMEKLREVQIERNPFKAAIDGIKELKEAREGLVKLDEKGESTGIVISEEEVRRLQEAADKAKVIAETKSQSENKVLQDLERQREELIKYTLPEDKFKKGDNGEYTNEYTDEFKKQLAYLNQKIEAKRKDVNLSITEAELQGKISHEYAEQLRNYTNAQDKIQKGAAKSLNMIATISGEASSAITDIAGNLENVFGTMSAGTKDTIDSISEILGGVSDMAGGAARVVANPADIGGYFQAAKGLAKTIGSIFSIGDKKKEREIQRQIKNIENLGKAYDELKEKMEAAWSADDLRTQTKDTVANLDQQIESYKSMIKAEEDKKKTDHARIEEWNDTIKELEKNKKEILDEEKKYMGGIGGESEYKSAAESFVQAWMDAFNETGNGLKGLEENFDDMINNLFLKQASMRIANNFLKPLFEMIDLAVTEGEEATRKGFDGSTELTREEMDKIVEEAKNQFPQLSEALEQLYNALGLKNNKTAELSSLTQSIQGLTEQTADELAAILESVRFFVAQQTTDISAIRALLDARYGLEAEYSDSNPMLVELRAQTGYLEQLSDYIGRVFAPSPNSKGPALRVVMQ